MPPRVLFVGRQPDHYAALWRQLGQKEIELVFAASPKRALRELASAPADLIVLDTGSVLIPASQICRSLRQQAPEARLILVAEPDTAAGLAYDYHLHRPTTWRRLLEAIETTLASERREVVAAGEFVLDLHERTLLGPAGEGRLTPKLFGLLRLLMVNANQVITRSQIMHEVWNTDFIDDTRTLDVHISWLRRIVEPDPSNPRYLCTKRGKGYMFLPTGSEARTEVVDEPRPA